MRALPPTDPQRRTLRERQQALIRHEQMGRPTDREELAAVLFETAQKQLRLRRLPVLLEAHDDIANQAAARAVRAHEERGQQIIGLFRGLFTLFVESAAVDVARAARDLPAPFSAYESEDGHNPVMDLASTGAPSIDEQVNHRQILRDVIASYPALDAYLVDASDKVRLIAELAMQGHPRREIADRVSALIGETVSADSVRQVITRRLNAEFPQLRFLWDSKQAVNVTDAARHDRRRIRTERRTAADQAFTLHLRAASPLVRALADARLDLASRRADWTTVATAVQESQGRVITSTEAKLAWEQFLADLPEAARGVDR